MRRGRPHHRMTPPHCHQRIEGPANSQGIREISLPEARNVFYHQSRSTSAAKPHDGSCRPEKSLEKNIQDGRCNNGVDIERCVPLFLVTFARFWVKRVPPSDFLLIIIITREIIQWQEIILLPKSHTFSLDLCCLNIFKPTSFCAVNQTAQTS